ncbi:hypothetical protein JTE90_025477 [Oedothorax gibbosus]|uniref:Protein-tyrosine sulfotransferase n=1 Tax=Oedothorax gibbosus TaxID=931172 RepID=A0AAV6UZD9_9ARAC|nr:hypothetical protein JTE90_025477 [Oedothorax gibbosus]
MKLSYKIILIFFGISGILPTSLRDAGTFKWFISTCLLFAVNLQIMIFYIYGKVFSVRYGQLSNIPQNSILAEVIANAILFLHRFCLCKKLNDFKKITKIVNTLETKRQVSLYLFVALSSILYTIKFVALVKQTDKSLFISELFRIPMNNTGLLQVAGVYYSLNTAILMELPLNICVAFFIILTLDIKTVLKNFLDGISPESLDNYQAPRNTEIVWKGSPEEGMCACRSGRQAIVCVLVCCITCGFIVCLWLQSDDWCFSVGLREEAVMVPAETLVEDSSHRKYLYSRTSPLVFIGGFPRSGTTLVRVLVDSHPDIRCGEETRIIPRVLGLKSQWMRSPMEAGRLREAGITTQVLDSALAAFILEIIVRHGKPAKRLCNKDPFSLRSSVYLHSLFPNAKFILMLRDGRAVVHSMITRKVTISNLNLNDTRQCLRRWNVAVQSMYSQCRLLGPSVCLSVHYERLVLHPEPTMRSILEFLELPWNSSVLHHEELIGKDGGVSLSILERSTDQVIKPINTEALTRWVGHFPDDVILDMNSLAPMLATLGYDPRANPPDYGRPDALVVRNTLDLRANKRLWQAQEKVVENKRQEIWKSWAGQAKFRATEVL